MNKLYLKIFIFLTLWICIYLYFNTVFYFNYQPVKDIFYQFSSISTISLSENNIPITYYYAKLYSGLICKINTNNVYMMDYRIKQLHTGINYYTIINNKNICEIPEPINVIILKNKK